MATLPAHTSIDSVVPPTTDQPPALLLAGHGTREAEGVTACLALVDRMRELLPDVRVEAGFVELTPPTIDKALDDLLAAEPSGVVVVPLMIGTGGHVREDIPEAIEAGRGGRTGATVVYTRHLGAARPLVGAALERIDAARGAWAPEETTVIIVGRGCSVTDANADHARLARVLHERGGYARVLPAYIQVVPPGVTRALDEAYAAGARRIVVMPHYLFAGRLLTWVREETAPWATAHPDAEVRVADVIGPCDELAQVVVQRYREGALHARTDLRTEAFLSGLVLADRSVVAVGGGCVSRRRVPALLAAGARVTVVAPTLHPRLTELAESGRITWVERPFDESDLDGAWYVLAATDDPALNARIAAASEARHTFCARADNAREGTAWVPALGTVDGATIAVVAAHDPRRSSALRDRVVGLLADAPR